MTALSKRIPGSLTKVKTMETAIAGTRQGQDSYPQMVLNKTPFTAPAGQVSTELVVVSHIDITTNRSSFDIEDLSVGFPEDFLFSLYTVDKPSRIRSFFRKYPRIHAVLDEAFDALRHYFPTEELRLEKYTDPEDSDEDSEVNELAVFIVSHDEPEEALSKLDGFDETWWQDRADIWGSLLTFNVEYA